MKFLSIVALNFGKMVQSPKLKAQKYSGAFTPLEMIGIQTTPFLLRPLNSHLYYKWRGFLTGFTLLELMIVIAILAIISALAIPFYQSFQVSSGLMVVTQDLARTLRRAEVMAQADQLDSPWGVYFGDNQFILFKGNDFSGRNPDYDQIFDYPAIISVANDFSNQIYFSQYSGLPSASGTVTLISANEGIKRVIINGEGKVEVE